MATLTTINDSDTLLVGTTAGNKKVAFSEIKTAATQQIQSSISTNIQECYSACQTKGATIPTQKNISNLANTITTIETGYSSGDIGSVDESKNVTGSIYGNVSGSVYGNVCGYVYGNVGGVGCSVYGSVCGNVCGSVYGGVSGSVYGHINGNADGNIGGDVGGYVNGNIGSVTASNSEPASFTSIYGSVGGIIEGYVGGGIYGTNASGYGVIGSVSGSIWGNVQQNVLGTISGYPNKGFVTFTSGGKNYSGLFWGNEY